MMTTITTAQNTTQAMKSRLLCVTSLLLSLALISAPHRGHAQLVDASLPPVAQSGPRAPTNLIKLMLATPPALTLKAGDMYEVKLFPIDLYEAKGRIESDGSAVLPLVGRVVLSGLTVNQAQEAIRERLQLNGQVIDPQVNFVVTEQPSETVSVSGELMRPGVFPALGSHRLYDYIAKAEGLKPTAGHTITLIRAGRTYTIPLDPDPATAGDEDVPIFAGDAIIVPLAGVVYIVGAVKTQGGYPLKTGSPTTALELVALGGGVGFEAQLNGAVLVRKTAAGSVEIPVHLRAIMRGKEIDPPVLPNDILLVPTDAMKAAIKGGAANLAGSLVAAVLYTETR